MGRHPTWQYLIDWCGIMAEKYNRGECYEKDRALSWDWGQALMRLAYGKDWMENAEFHKMNDTIPPEDPAPQFIVNMAKEWANGKEPDWFDVERTAVR
jgi:hypothetical protein